MSSLDKHSTEADVEGAIEQLLDTAHLLDDTVYEINTNNFMDHLKEFLDAKGVSVKSYSDGTKTDKYSKIIPESSIADLVGENETLELDVAERTYRLANKIILTTWETMNPRDPLIKTLEIFNYLNDGKNTVKLMDSLSNSISSDQGATWTSYKVMPRIMTEGFSKIKFEYETAISKIKDRVKEKDKQEEQLEALEAHFQSFMNSYICNIEDMTTMLKHGQLEEDKLMEKVFTLENEVNFGGLKKKNNHNISREEYSAEVFNSFAGTYSIALNENNSDKATKLIIDDFEKDIGGQVMGIKYSRDLSGQERELTIHADSETNGRIVYKIQFPAAVSHKTNEFVDALLNQASTRRCGGDFNLAALNSRTKNSVQKGYLMSR
ncbi:hypothetical protein ACFLTH_04345 [Bacteroidota bacterium]